MAEHMTQTERDHCILLYRNGTTRAWLAEHFARHLRTIDRLIARRGAKRRKAS